MPLTEQTQRQSVQAHRPANFQSSSAVKQKTTASAKVCWIEEKRYPYQPDHQMELLHLQAEADALLIKLQAADQKQGE